MKTDTSQTDSSAATPSLRRLAVIATAAAVLTIGAFVLASIGGLLALPIASLLSVLVWLRLWRLRARGRRALVLGIFAGLPLLAAMYLVATGSGISPSLVTGERTYKAGDTATIELRAGLRTVGYNLCGSHFERRNGATWLPARSASANDVVCTSELRLLGPLGRATGDVELAPSLSSGAYRLTEEVEVGGQRRLVATPQFIVTR